MHTPNNAYYDRRNNNKENCANLWAKQTRYFQRQNQMFPDMFGELWSSDTGHYADSTR